MASGASESEIFIWDLNSPDKPMTPGAKAQVGGTTFSLHRQKELCLFVRVSVCLSVC